MFGPFAFTSTFMRTQQTESLPRMAASAFILMQVPSCLGFNLHILAECSSFSRLSGPPRCQRWGHLFQPTLLDLVFAFAALLHKSKVRLIHVCIQEYDLTQLIHFTYVSTAVNIVLRGGDGSWRHSLQSAKGSGGLFNNCRWHNLKGASRIS